MAWSGGGYPFFGKASRDLKKLIRANGHLQITADGTEFWLRRREDGVHTRGRWEEDVRRYRDVSRDSFLGRARELPAPTTQAAPAG